MSNLLQKASIITTPTAYNDGKLLSVKPVEYYGPELITNGNFATNSDWVLSGLNLSISNGKGISTGSNFGAQFKQTILQTYKSYKLTFDIVDYTSGSIGLTANYYGVASQYNSLGTHTTIFTSLSQTEFRLYSQDFVGSVDNVSVKEVSNADFDFTRGSSATRVGSNGLIQTVASGLPRIDYSGGVGHILTEPERTNLITYSEDFSQINYINSTVSINNNISPDGTINGNLWLADAVSSPKELDELYSVTSGTTYTESWFVKYKSLQFIQMVTTSATFGAKYGNFDLINGTLGSGNFTDFSIKSYSNGWYRISATQAATSTGSGRLGGLRMIASATAPRGGNVTTVGTESVETWGHQVEAGSYQTSYIKSNIGNATTRLAETLNNSGSADLINSTEGVLMVEASALSNDGTFRNISISDGSTPNSIRIFQSNTSNALTFLFFLGNATQAVYTHIFDDITTYYKVAFQYKLNDFKVYVNGLNTYTHTSGSVFNPNTLNKLQFNSGAAGERFYGKTKCVAVFKDALSDLELECLTSWMSFADMGIALGYTIE